MQNKRLFAFCGLLLAVFSILIKEEIQSMWDIFLWIPIGIGFSMWFNIDDFMLIFKKERRK